MSKGKSKSGSIKNSIISYLWFCLVVGALLAAWNLLNISETSFLSTLKAKSDALKLKYEDCYRNDWNCSDGRSIFDISQELNTTPSSQQSNNQGQSTNNETQNQTTNQTIPSDNQNQEINQETRLSNIESLRQIPATSINKDEILRQLNNLNVVGSYDKVPYKRTEWRHWANIENSSCWTYREEALYQQATPNTIILLDKSKKETKDKSKACSIKSGEWKDPYSNEIITDPTKTDLDHTSALAATARAGGQNWDKGKKQDFANDLDHLVITTQKQNRTKGDKTPSEWMPENTEAHCDYAKIYTNILYKYKLNITQADKEVLSNAIGVCQY